MLAVQPLARSRPAGRRRGHRAPLLQMGHAEVTKAFIAADPKGGGTLEKLAVAVGQIRRRHGAATDYNRLYRDAVAGNIPVHRIGGRLFVDRRDYPTIADWLRRTPTRRRRVA